MNRMVISTLAGSIVNVGPFTPSSESGDNGSAKASEVGNPEGITLGPDGSIYFIGNSVVRKISKGMNNILSGETPVVSKDGKETYIFDSGGKHLRTLNTLTGKSIYKFNYDPDGLLSSVADVDGLTTTIERDSIGRTTAIISIPCICRSKCFHPDTYS